jgi:hypothetical protein
MANGSRSLSVGPHSSFEELQVGCICYNAIKISTEHRPFGFVISEYFWESIKLQDDVRVLSYKLRAPESTV